MYPRSIPALRPGDSLTLVGKLVDGDPAALRGEVRLRGRGPSAEVDERFGVMLDAEYSGAESSVHAHLPRTWAQHEITHLTQTEGAQARERIVALSREYNVLSRFTALLVLENDRMYREFNVARKAGDKDTWKGDLPAADSSAVTSTTARASKSDAAPSPTPAAPAEFEPLAPIELSERRDRDSFFGGESAGGSEDFGDFDGESEADEGKRWESAPVNKPKSNKPKGSSISGGDMFDDWGGGGGWSQPHHHWRPRMQLREAGGPSASDLARIADLQAARDRDPTQRKAHRDLVRRAVRDGDPNALAFAAAWAVADPDHAPALLAHADSLAAAGDPLAARAYASAVEVSPFSTKLHRRMADSLTLAGDLERACSHRRALVSIDPSSGRHAAALVECLVAAGHLDRARATLTTARGQRPSGSRGDSDRAALDRAARAITEGPSATKHRLHGSPDLRAELRWPVSEGADFDMFDIAFVDRRGRRLSALRPQGVLVREQRDGGEFVQILTMREVSGTVFVEVTRNDSRAESPIRARLTVKTRTGWDSWGLLLEPGTRRVASARWR